MVQTVSVHWRHSLRFKLFVLMTLTLLVAISGISVHNGMRYWEQQKKQTSQEAMNEANRSANAAASTIELWSNLVTAIMQESLGPNGASAADIARRIDANLVSNPKFVAISIHTIDGSQRTGNLTFGFTPHESSTEFQDVKPDTLKDSLRRHGVRSAQAVAQELAGKGKSTASPLVISNIAADAGLDVIQVRKIFEHQPSKSHFVFHLYIWPENLRSLTKHTANLQSYVISKDSKTVLSAKNSPTKPGTLFSSPNLALVVSGNAPMSSRSYEDPQRGPIIEVITSIPNTELHFVVERTSAAELAQIRQDVKMTALLSWIFVLLTLMASFLASQAVTKKINEAVQATLRIASGDLKTRIAADRRDEVGLLAMAVNHMASRIVTLLEVAVEAARQERELKTAQAVQKTLFKENARQGDIIAVQGHFEPASECAGDWWFDLSLSPTRRLVIIADATGHGASAALIVALAFSYFQTLHLLARSDGLLHKGPASILSDLNTLLVQSGRGATTMTLFLADIDTETMTMRYTNAGHVPPILIPRAADDDRLPKKSANLGKKRVLPVLGGGVPLGFDGTSVFQEHETTVRRGDRLFFYTDGLIECLGVDGQSMTAMDLRRQLAELTDEDPDGNLCQTIVRLARERLGNTPRNDDITMVVAEICPFAAQAASPMHSKEGDAA